MTYTFSKDFLLTHPYLGDHTKETREMCNPNKSNLYKNRGNVNNIEDPKQQRICTNGDLINQAIKKIVNKLSKKCQKNNDNLKKKSQNHLDITEVRERSTSVKQAKDAVNDTTKLLVKLSSDMREQLGTLKIQSENQGTADTIIRQKADIKDLNKKITHFQKIKQMQTEDINNYKKQDEQLIKQKKECQKNKSILKQVDNQLKKKTEIRKDIKIKKNLEKLIQEQKKLGNKKKVIELEKNYNLLIQKVKSNVLSFKQKSKQLNKFLKKKISPD